MKKIYERYAKEQKVKEVFEGMQGVDTVFASIGSLFADEKYRKATPSDTRELFDEMSVGGNEWEAIVGDVNYSFFDADGRTKPKWNLFLTLDVEHLRQMVADRSKQVVIIVGNGKIRALKALLRGEACNVLITDADAAQELLGHP